jgi:hypothetical protein
MHSAEQGSDGAIDRRELRFLYPGVIDPSWLDELEAAGFWQKTDAGYQFIDWAGRLGQSTAADVNAVREGNRLRKQAQRERARAARDGAGVAETERIQGVTPPDEIGGAEAAQSRRESRRDTKRDARSDVTRQDRKAGQAGRQDLPALPRRGSRAKHDCVVDGHQILADGTCTKCEYRDRDRIAQLSTIGRTA